jgi:TPR repeat protein
MAATYYKKAVGRNPADTKSMEGLVQIYLDAKDTSNYSKWVKTCALYEIKTTGGARCKLLYGMDLIKAGDEKAGTAFLSDALDWGESSAANYLGAYFNDRGKTDKAIFWLTKSAELGDPTGLKMLQDLTYSSGQFDIWKKWTLRSAEDGNIKDIGKYALYAVIGDKDYAAGKKWGARGAQQDDPLSMFALGYSYWKADRDLVNAKKWLTKSANLKSELAIRTLGDIYRSEKDYLNSASWYAKGADLGDFTSSYFASLTYFAGLNDVATSCKYVNISINLANSESKTRKLNDEEQGQLVEIQDLKSNICN